MVGLRTREGGVLGLLWKVNTSIGNEREMAWKHFVSERCLISIWGWVGVCSSRRMEGPLF